MMLFYSYRVLHRDDMKQGYPWSRCMTLCCLLLFFVVFFKLPLTAKCQNQDLIRIGFSASFFEEINQNDAVAAIRAWTRALLNKEDISAVPKPHIFNSIAKIRELIISNQIDYIGMTSIEYAEIRDILPVENITVSVNANSITEEYLLLVNRDSDVNKLKDLEGRNLQLVKGARMSLSSIWLDTILLKEKLKPAAVFFSSIESQENTKKVILPMFFNKKGACVVSRNVFETMVELNPQIGQRFKTISVSPPLVPSFFCFTTNSDMSLREKVLKEISIWNLSPFGKQSLTIFQSDGLEIQSIKCLESALNMIREHKKLMNENSSVNTNGSTLSQGAG